MTTVTEEFLAWAATLPDWQRDALRRLTLKIEVGDDEYSEIFGNAKASVGLADSCKMTAISSSDLEIHGNDQAEQTILSALGPMTNVDRLADGQVLPISERGITIIYGANGTGKSGYCRVLKQLCRALDRDDSELKGDAFQDTPQRPPKVRVAYRSLAQNHTVVETWCPDDMPPPALAQISVFDASNAALYVNEENKIDFLPAPLDLITRFRLLIERINQEIGTVIAAEEAALPFPFGTDFDDESPAGSLIQKLVIQTELEQLPTEEQLRDAAKWDDKSDTEILARLSRKLADDPAVMGKAYADAQKQIQFLAAGVKAIELRLAPKKLREFEEKTEALTKAEMAARAAGQEVFKDYPVPRTGTEPWRDMYLAAREFAKHAGISPPFSAVGEEDKCVLCQQPLSVVAVNRLKRFDEFVEGELQKKATILRSELEEIIAGMLEHRLPDPEAAENAIKIATREEKLPTEIQEVSSFSTAAQEVRSLLKDVAKFRKISTDAMTSNLSGRLAVLENSFKEKSEELLAQVTDKDKEKSKRAELMSFQDRKRLNGQLDQMLDRRGRIVRRAHFLTLKASLGLAKISNKVTSIRRHVLTDSMTERLQKELSDLDLKQLPVGFFDKTEKGVSKGSVSLTKGAQRLKNKDILSDGEQRALALACFLAEAEGISNNQGLIIDDPVSSLDEERIRKVARRIARAAANGRQIIVFTHNMFFISEIRDAAAEASVDAAHHYVYRSPAPNFGIVANNQLPWELKPIKERLGIITTQISNLSNSEIDPEEYKNCVTRISALLRTSWERAVEEKLLQGVVKRYGRPVATQMLHSVEVTDEDFKTVHFGMKRVSEWSGHDNPEGAPLPPPKPDELQDEVDKLTAFVDKLNKRQGSLSSDRKKLVPS